MKIALTMCTLSVFKCIFVLSNGECSFSKNNSMNQILQRSGTCNVNVTFAECWTILFSVYPGTWQIKPNTGLQYTKEVTHTSDGTHTYLHIIIHVSFVPVPFSELNNSTGSETFGGKEKSNSQMRLEEMEGWIGRSLGKDQHNFAYFMWLVSHAE